MSLTKNEKPSGNNGLDGEEFFLGWCGHNVAKLTFNGANWSFNYENGWMLPLSGGHFENPGQLPSFVLNLMPEAREGRANQVITLEEILNESDRFLSNIVISKKENTIGKQAPDMLEGRLTDFSEDTVFKGQHTNLPTMTQGVLVRMDHLVKASNIPRMSGCQAKLPCNLSEEGILAPADGKSFSHILKLPGFLNDQHNLRGAVEWASMSMAKAGGVNTCEFSLVDMQGSQVLAYVAERFDVPVNKEDKRLMYSEDFCSSMGQTPGGKYFESLEEMILTLRRLSTQPEKDCSDFLRLVYANKLLENGDFHLKNAAILREVSPDLKSFSSTILSPAYDIMNTRYFNARPLPPHLPETMALEFQGDQENYTMKHMVAIGKLLGMEKTKTLDIMFDVADGIAEKARDFLINVPDVFDKPEYANAKMTVMHAGKRALTFCSLDFPEINPFSNAQSKSPKP